MLLASSNHHNCHYFLARLSAFKKPGNLLLQNEAITTLNKAAHLTKWLLVRGRLLSRHVSQGGGFGKGGATFWLHSQSANHTHLVPLQPLCAPTHRNVIALMTPRNELPRRCLQVRVLMWNIRTWLLWLESRMPVSKRTLLLPPNRGKRNTMLRGPSLKWRWDFAFPKSNIISRREVNRLQLFFLFFSQLRPSKPWPINTSLTWRHEWLTSMNLVEVSWGIVWRWHLVV